LGDRLLAGEVADLVDRAHHLAVDRVVQNFFDEAAVDLQEVDREVLQITERRKARAEIVEREAAADFLERVNETIRLTVARDGRSFRDLEADARARQTALLELLDHERQELLVGEALAREIDR